MIIYDRQPPWYFKNISYQMILLMDSTNDIIDPLIEQEINILKLIAGGHTNKDIAEILNISPLTVKTHRQRIIIKFHAQNFCEVINKAAKSGLI